MLLVRTKQVNYDGMIVSIAELTTGQLLELLKTPDGTAPISNICVQSLNNAKAANGEEWTIDRWKNDLSPSIRRDLEKDILEFCGLETKKTEGEALAAT